MEKKLSEIVFEYRVEHNLSREKFAALCGISNQTAYYIENEKKEPSKMTVAKILKFIEKN